MTNTVSLGQIVKITLKENVYLEKQAYWIDCNQSNSEPFSVLRKHYVGWCASDNISKEKNRFVIYGLFIRFLLILFEKG